MVITKKERDLLIKKISYASGIAQYALEKKMTDEQVIKAAKNLEILQLVKDANNYNRHCQSLKTEEANNKLKEFININNSEVFKAGKWLFGALSLTGQERKKTLLAKELVHKDDYNETLSGMRDTIEGVTEVSKQITLDAQETIQSLECKIDVLKNQLANIKQYISCNYGSDKWELIKKTFNVR